MIDLLKIKIAERSLRLITKCLIENGVTLDNFSRVFKWIKYCFKVRINFGSIFFYLCDL